ncbi:MAG: 4-(cytidine 5'-diphospho)-2-C-methyl-D-erythritol kinase [Cyanobacteria bacterium]|nr:4-(cytidine 5'-diphospho)-2-C-methyl-D-erythritol kinase [Cyanobacteriota bacterium]
MPTSKDSPTTLKAQAFAKINLGLNVLGPREDGFHDLQSVFCRVGWHDTLSFTLETNPEKEKQHNDKQLVQFSCAGPQAGMLITDKPNPGKPNLVITAATAFLEAYFAMNPEAEKPALTIHLEKYIPVQAGLGGGSSDAAATLNTLNDLFQQHFSGKALPEKKVYDLACQLGSDVPFFLADVDLAYVTGRGEHIQPLKSTTSSLPWSVLIVKPKHVNISTVWAYQALREQNQYQTRDLTPFLDWLNDPSELPLSLKTWLSNDFEALMLPLDPIFRDINAVFSSLGAAHCMMSGSGPSMVGFFESMPTQAEIEDAFQKSGLTHKTDYWVQEHS